MGSEGVVLLWMKRRRRFGIDGRGGRRMVVKEDRNPWIVSSGGGQRRRQIGDLEEGKREVVGVREFDLLAKSALRVMCEAKISSKVKSLRWRLILDRLPTRSNLAKRGIIHNPHDKK
ncbi:hypothetical protein KIW84_065739 [Lathyrus oleraceus]|uniref:Uncharacterized protein n=1 Tax=Pisum sativum TaxID=3888 RepID=A0A9D4WGA9_PEA|nr:hypothetical protein KIW84_065739 [Pisum sativum]